jgi:hypothetical protein
MLPPENLLAGEKSPYLLQHAANPVHWRPWGPAALADASALNRPILLSIGYAACHWCHVMAHESFENPETAALMNALFVNIKVDREERPDIDHIYMAALHAMDEQGGWPLTMFLAPDATPFWGGTYFPPEPRWGRPSFPQILQAVAQAWQNQDRAVTVNGASLVRALTAGAATRPGSLPTTETLSRAATAYLRITDPVNGGLGGAPKFPNAPIFRFLWQHGIRHTDARCTDAVHLMLQRMAQGGIYDHLGGGFARYSTDAQWLAPHFEKMLYDNAQLLDLLALAHAAQPAPLYAARARETLTWLTRDMATNGAFAASEDADSEGEEGRFYIWDKPEIDALLGDTAAPFTAAYDVTDAGNWEGHTILRRITGEGSAEAESRLGQARQILFAAREKRIRPGRDDKILADWNGLMIGALARAASVFGEPAWLTLAESSFASLLALLGAPDGRVAHAWRDGKITASGLLDDQAFVTAACLALFEATGKQDYLRHAIHIATATLTHFADTDGSLFLTADDASDVPAIRPRTAADNATPSGQGTMAAAFARLFHLTGDTAWRDQSERIIAAFSGATDQLAGMVTLLAASDLLQNATVVAIAGDPLSRGYHALLQTALTAADPTVVVLHAPTGHALPLNHPAHGKTALNGQAAAYLCRNQTCGLPITDAMTLHNNLNSALP